MSLLNTIKEPADLLKKLVREANSINFEDDEEKLSDLVFNFSVTCHSLRDWCVKYLGKESSQGQLHIAWNTERSLQIAKDIANSKHFGVTKYVTTVKSAEKIASKTVEFRSDHDIPDLLKRVDVDHTLRESLEKPVPSYQIEFTDGTRVSLWEYVLQAVRYWLAYFDAKGIPRDVALSTTHIYIVQSHWGQLA